MAQEYIFNDFLKVHLNIYEYFNIYDNLLKVVITLVFIIFMPIIKLMKEIFYK